MAVILESLEDKKARAEEANALLNQLDEVTQKAAYIAINMFLAKKETAMEGQTAKGAHSQ